MSSSSPGKVYLIPNYLSEGQDQTFIAPLIYPIVQNLEYYLVENIRTTRRFISSLKLDIDISGLRLEQMDKRFDNALLSQLFEPVMKGTDMGIQSEAGLPGIADPGRLAISYAHEHKINVITLPGSSSIILGLIASGFNGQQFTFHGYLPIDKSKRLSTLKNLEKEVQKTGYTQVFMETPYRNEELLKQLTTTLHPNTMLFIGKDMTGKHEKVISQRIAKWKKTDIDLHKIPAIFAIGKYH
jgi:16S rRNA (cytidine1402-2'-O)-methyltransferase